MSSKPIKFTILCKIDCKYLKRLKQRSSYKGRMVNALASGADEGRDKLR